MRFFHVLFGVVCAVSVLAFSEETKNWALSTSLENSVGIGTLVAGYRQTPSWTTSLSFNPSYQFHGFDLSANQTISVWWLNSYQTSASDVQDRVSLSDLSLHASRSKIFYFETSGFSFNAGLGLSVPVSSFSRNLNRILGFNLSLPVGWSKWGINAGFRPSVFVWTYSNSVISVPCYEMPSAMINPYNINSDIDQAIQGLSIVRNGDERLGDGQCLVSGRQNTWTLNNALSLGWSNPDHSVSASFGWSLNFLRPLEYRPDLKSENASPQNFNETTMGRIAYSYTIPIETSLVVSAGILSFQGSRDKSGNLTFPFFDFVTPGNNQTQIFLQATVEI